MSRVFTPMMPIQPVSQPKTIENLLETLDERIELHPPYQRDISWTLENMGELIMSVMCCGFIPGILLYKLQAGDERREPNYRAECVDGQHRFFVFSHYYKSQAFMLGKKKVMITLPYKGADGNITHVFYKQTPDTDRWEEENRSKRVAYMTEDEKDHFNSFLLDIREVRSPLTLDQRCALFLSLQKGTPVRGSNFYKNKDLPLVKFITYEKHLEMPTKNLLAEHLTMNPVNYWLHWLIRMYLIQQASDSDERVAAFMTKDSEISQMMKSGAKILNSTPETQAAFSGAVDRFFTFLESLAPGVKLTPSQFYAVFTYLLDAEEGREDIIVSHMRQWSTPPTGSSVYKKQWKAWENRGVDDAVRKDFFERSLDEVERISVPAMEVGARKNIPKKIRDKVWAKAFGASEEGACVCCKTSISVNNWEQGHVIAHACGGKEEESNLQPICRSCNRSMGTENLWLFKARCYPTA